ncbi:hypothetical protein LVD13_01580 [Flavobacteriaceae bacterium D16]|nr:hypothetical protein [Flavobacteriaceae bacterium D16]
MKAFCSVVALLLFVGCISKVDPASLPLLNGYWEIEKVVFPDGNTKTYEVNTSIDFIEINGKEGFRKKMQPQFNGTYNTSNDAEQFTILSGKNALIIKYSNAEISWEETLLSLSEERFEVISETGVTYHYKRYKPLELD